MLQRYNNNKRRGYIRFISSNEVKIKRSGIELLVIRQMAIVGRVEHQSIIRSGVELFNIYIRQMAMVILRIRFQIKLSWGRLFTFNIFTVLWLLSVSKC